MRAVKVPHVPGVDAEGKVGVKSAKHGISGSPLSCGRNRKQKYPPWSPEANRALRGYVSVAKAKKPDGHRARSRWKGIIRYN